MKLLILTIVLMLTSYTFAYAITDNELREKVEKPRWLSIESSRIALNPVGISHTGELVPHFSNGAFASMGVNAGYFYGEFPHRVPTIWCWKPILSNIKDTANIGLEYLDIMGSNWTEKGAYGQRQPDGIEITQYEEKDRFGFIESDPITIDMNKTPIIYIDIAGEEMDNWGLKIGLKGEADIPIINNTVEKGNFAFDLRNYVKWTGKKEVYVRVFTVGEEGLKIKLKGIGFGGINEKAAGFEKVEEYWQPSQINHIAKSKTRQINIDATTFFADADTISQRIIITQSNKDDLIMSGIWNKGNVDYLPTDNVMIIHHPEYAIVLAFSGKPIAHRYASMNDYIIGKTSDSKDGYWTLRYKTVKKGDVINVSAVFVGGGNVTQEHIDKAKKNIEDTFMHQALLNRESDWNEKFSKVPQPESFDLTKLDYVDTTPDLLKRMYYKAWTFIYSDILPPTPENGFNYPQFACGKPSLWSEGHHKARPSAQWESIIAMQFGAYVTPTLAWDSLEGLMTLVDEKGTMGGEGLPSRHAQTAWILYNLTGDKERLARIYPNMKRLLDWKVSDPRWIYKGLTENTEKDSEFVTQALTDITYMINICKVLDLPQEIPHWEQSLDSLYSNFTKWFWKERGGDAYRLYREGQGPLGEKHTWTLACLGLANGVLEEPEHKSLITLYNQLLNKDIPFLFSGFIKHPSRQLLMRGLLWTDMYSDAEIFAESTLRDVTRAKEFSESYDGSNPPKTEGVTPSIFGVANVIDSSLWLNGIWISEGLPIIIDLRTGGVKNLSIRGKILNISIDKNNNVIISGTATEILQTPSNFTKEGNNFIGNMNQNKKLELKLI